MPNEATLKSVWSLPRLSSNKPLEDQDAPCCKRLVLSRPPRKATPCGGREIPDENPEASEDIGLPQRET